MSSALTFRFGSNTARSLVRSVLFVFRMTLFFVMRMFRVPVRFLLGLGALLALCMFLTTLVLSVYNHWNLSMLGTSLALLAVAVAMNGLTWYYDVLLLKLTPPGYQIFLFQ